MESKLAAWLTAGLEVYKNSSVLTESIFYESSQTGRPSVLAPGELIDTEKLWLPNEYVGGFVRLGYQDTWGTVHMLAGTTYPVVSNTETTLTLTGDPSSVALPGRPVYMIVPAVALAFAHFLATETFTVSTAFAQIPTQFPAFSIRLERDTQDDTYLGESVTTSLSNGTAVDMTTMHLVAHHVISIWSVNREGTLWLYAWLVNYALRSVKQFATWGLFDVSIGGSDLDPVLQYLPERGYVRHVLLSATRPERAITTRDVEVLTGFEWEICVHYQTFDLLVPAME